MDVKKIGHFLAELRKERDLTQEQLGDKLGVTNKTVSRWENGNYLPPVEMLQQLSEFYGITINEILSAERLTEDQYLEKAEQNIQAALKNSSFTLKEKQVFYKRKWRKEHWFDYLLGILVTVGLYAAGAVMDNGLQLVGLIWCVFFTAERNNAMMRYVEDRAFDGSGQQ
ncbi:MAG: helix-turn-helix transcriptional regulator [Faecousia sp.]